MVKAKSPLTSEFGRYHRKVHRLHEFLFTLFYKVTIMYIVYFIAYIWPPPFVYGLSTSLDLCRGESRATQRCILYNELCKIDFSRVCAKNLLIYALHLKRGPEKVQVKRVYILCIILKKIEIIYIYKSLFLHLYSTSSTLLPGL